MKTKDINKKKFLSYDEGKKGGFRHSFFFAWFKGFLPFEKTSDFIRQ